MTIQDCAAWAAALGTIFATVLTALNLRRETQWRREDKRQRSENEKREQAACIAAWILTDQKSGGTKEDIIRIYNHSFSPVYRCVATFVINEQNGSHYPAEYRRILTTLPPGEWQLAAPKGWRGMCARPGVEIAFTDAHGVHWLRNAVGQLQESPIDAIKHYGVELPYSPDRLTPATT